MATQIILENEYFTLWYHEGPKIVHHQFHQFIHGDPFRKCLLEGVSLLEKHGACKWLSDDRKNAAIPEEDIRWSAKTWQFMAFRAGWKYWAIVLPKKMVGKLTIQNIISTAIEPGKLTAQLFQNPAEAKQWLENQ